MCITDQQIINYLLAVAGVSTILIIVASIKAIKDINKAKDNHNKEELIKQERRDKYIFLQGGYYSSLRLNPDEAWEMYKKKQKTPEEYNKFTKKMK